VWAAALGGSQYPLSSRVNPGVGELTWFSSRPGTLPLLGWQPGFDRGHDPLWDSVRSKSGDAGPPSMVAFRIWTSIRWQYRGREGRRNDLNGYFRFVPGASPPFYTSCSSCMPHEEKLGVGRASPHEFAAKSLSQNRSLQEI